ncbi:hypothetical protein [uncultured Cloacibacillus sp.]|nr:hypothetical protein [uncultured Cloacibacillus sp.]
MKIALIKRGIDDVFQLTRSLERDSAVSPNDETHASFQLTHS